VKAIAVAVALVAGLAPYLWAQSGSAPGRLLERRYVEDERLDYLMTGQDGGTSYEVHITGITKRAPDGSFLEEFAWSDYSVNGKPRPLSPTSQAFRQTVTLGGGSPFPPPDVSKAPGLVGPVTDLLTFYADLFLAIHGGTVLRNAGDRFYFENPVAASWADGKVVIVGEDSIDFDITLAAVEANVATLTVKHVPPPQPKVRFVAEWMRAPVANTPNNWVQVRRAAEMYTASVGKETFDVTLRVALPSGHILSATMDNPVTKISRVCSDAALIQCGEARPDPTFRRIEMTLLSRTSP
jgi:hypothetical protein